MLLDPKANLSNRELAQKERRKYEDHFGLLDIRKSYKNLFEILWYSQLPCYDVEGITSTTKDQMSVIKRCFWKGKEVNCSSVFQKRPTDRGMCCSFNAMRADEMFRETTYRNMVSSMQALDETYSIDDNSLPDGYDSKSQAGQKKGLQLILDAHSDRVSSGTVPDSFKGFVGIVDGNENFPLTHKDGFLVRPGRTNNVAISAYQVVADDNVRNIKPDKRMCYFANEHPLEMHQNYTYTNCILECAVSVARDKLLEETGLECTPWFYPSSDEHVADLCDPWNTQKFIKLLVEVSNHKCAYCLSDCTGTSYKASISTAAFRLCDHTNLGTSPMCNLQDLTMNPPIWSQAVVNEYKVAKGHVPRFAAPNEKRQSNIRPYVYTEAQREALTLKNAHDKSPTYDAFQNDIAMANFYFEKSTILQYKRSQRLTLVGMISQIGGLLGVAMGVSFISMVEIVYWMTIRFFRNIESTSTDGKDLG